MVSSYLLQLITIVGGIIWLGFMSFFFLPSVNKPAHTTTTIPFNTLK